MIKSFGDKETQKIAGGESSRRLPKEVQYRAKMRLDRVNAATSMDDLRFPPSHRLESLKGDRKGQWSIRVNDQRRICFTWKDGNAWNVEIVDYH